MIKRQGGRKLIAGATLIALISFSGCAGDDELHAEPERQSLSTPDENVVDLAPTPVGTPTHEAADFWSKAAMSGMAEVELSRLALDKSQNAEVRQFAERMVTDHTRANEELQALAQKKGVSLPTTLDAEHQTAKQRLQGLSQAEFDRAYVDVMVKDHEAAVELFSEQAESASDGDVKSFAEKTLPILREHLKQIQVIHGKTR